MKSLQRSQAYPLLQWKAFLDRLTAWAKQREDERRKLNRGRG
jgi:hypothetical protein